MSCELPTQNVHVCVLPDDVIVVPQVEPLAVLASVVDHAHSGHKVHELLPRGVEQVIAALVAPVPVDPVQPEPAARGAPVRHTPSFAGNSHRRHSGPPPPASAGSVRSGGGGVYSGMTGRTCNQDGFKGLFYTAGCFYLGNY